LKLLIDNQLPAGLVRHLQSHGIEAIHVSNCGLSSRSDQAIWDYAKAQGFIVVTKDDDFVYLATQNADGPPVIWVRLGNCRNRTLFAAFDEVLKQLLEALRAGSNVIELR
jgi:predicted nuclease of predicted toxin-antitoxin system